MHSAKQQNIFQQPAAAKEFTGTIERITYRNEENNYIVARFLPEDAGKEVITIVGTLPAAVTGERMQITGEWQKHNKFGYQFQVKKLTVLLPVTKKGIENYLGSGLIKGIGPAYAQKIVHKFGFETFNVLDHDPDRLSEVEGIGEKRLNMIKQAWKSQSAVREIMVFLAERGISSTYALKIFKEYGNQTLSVLKQNPYRLADDIFGIGFLTADKIARNLGVDEDEPARIEAGIKYVLTRATEQGHLFLPEVELFRASSDLLNIPKQKVTIVCEELYRVSHLVNDNGAVYLNLLYNVEKGLAERLIQLKKAPVTLLNTEKIWRDTEKLRRLQGVEYSSRQKEALIEALKEKLLVITGGPGTGKTTIVKGIIQIFEYLGRRVFLTAPTGRAAKRLAESTGRRAQTIHRLLEFDPAVKQFKHNQKYPLRADMVIVDEMSMVDCTLAFHLVKAVPLNARLIIVGDVDQLPSVGAGNVLREIMDSGCVATVHLNEIFRQAQDSQIIINAHRINRGLMPNLELKKVQKREESVSSRFRLLPRDDYGDFLFVQEDDPEQIVSLIRELCEVKLPRRYNYKPKQDIQILTPMYRGILGADNLNRVMQEALNPNTKKISRGSYELRVGDRVMQIRNNYDKKVFNGDLGFVQQIDAEEQTVLILFEKSVEYDFSELDELVLAYAITVHKSQGSEYPVVIMPITTQHFIMLQRNLLYTAITRAKELNVLLGSTKALALAIKNNKVSKRNTRLAWRLRGS